jgi:hypothetical protein
MSRSSTGKLRNPDSDTVDQQAVWEFVFTRRTAVVLRGRFGERFLQWRSVVARCRGSTVHFASMACASMCASLRHQEGCCVLDEMFG